MRSVVKAFISAGILSLSTGAAAFEVFKDYVPSTEIYNVTFVRVSPNRIDEYLDGLRQTWMSNCDAAKVAGSTVDCRIYLSETAANSDFNLMLVIEQPNAAATDPNETRYKQIMAASRAKLAEDKEKQLVEGYQEMRTFFGEQTFRKITFK